MPISVDSSPIFPVAQDTMAGHPCPPSSVHIHSTRKPVVCIPEVSSEHHYFHSYQPGPSHHHSAIIFSVRIEAHVRHGETYPSPPQLPLPKRSCCPAMGNAVCREPLAVNACQVCFSCRSTCPLSLHPKYISLLALSEAVRQKTCLRALAPAFFSV
jgi:hypothetical protein